MSQKYKIVVVKNDLDLKRILRAGKQDFLNDGSFDPDKEEIINTGVAGKIPYNMGRRLMFWDAVKKEYIKGDRIIKEQKPVRSKGPYVTDLSNWQNSFIKKVSSVEGSWFVKVSLDIKSDTANIESPAQARLVYKEDDGGWIVLRRFSNVAAVMDSKSSQVDMTFDLSINYSFGIQYRVFPGSVNKCKISNINLEIVQNYAGFETV